MLVEEPIPHPQASYCSREVFLSENDVGHKIAVQEVLLVLFQKSENAGGEQRRTREKFIAEIHVGHGTPRERKRRDEHESDYEKNKVHDDKFTPPGGHPEKKIINLKQLV
jgi:hypothetical protein